MATLQSAAPVLLLPSPTTHRPIATNCRPRWLLGRRGPGFRASKHKHIAAAYEHSNVNAGREGFLEEVWKWLHCRSRSCTRFTLLSAPHLLSMQAARASLTRCESGCTLHQTPLLTVPTPPHLCCRPRGLPGRGVEVGARVRRPHLRPAAPPGLQRGLGPQGEQLYSLEQLLASWEMPAHFPVAPRLELGCNCTVGSGRLVCERQYVRSASHCAWPGNTHTYKSLACSLLLFLLPRPSPWTTACLPRSRRRLCGCTPRG